MHDSQLLLRAFVRATVRGRGELAVWHRLGWRLFWRWKSTGHLGRPRLAIEVREASRPITDRVLHPHTPSRNRPTKQPQYAPGHGASTTTVRLETEYMGTPARMKVFLDLLPITRSRPVMPAAQTPWDELGLAVEQVRKGAPPAWEALEGVTRRVNAELAQVGG